MKTKIKLQKDISITTREEAESITNEYASLANNLRLMTSLMDAKITAIREEFGPALELLQADIDKRADALCDWAQTNPSEFPKGRKSIEFPSGIIGFRTGTPKLALLSRAWSWEKVTAAVQQLLPNFIRNKPEVDKEAIIGQREELGEFLPSCGLKITQGETFFVEPNLTQTETRQTVTT